jgi:tetratricopeptide (TPR) repeat protein
MLDLVQNDPAQAEQILEAALARQPGDLMAARLLGLTKRNLGKAEQSVKWFQWALQMLPDAETHNQLALSFRDLGDFKQAITNMKFAVLRDSSCQNWINLGKLYVETLQVHDAIYCFQEALKREPNAAAHNDLAIAYGLLGQWDVCFSEYEWRFDYFEHLSRYRHNYHGEPWDGTPTDKTIVLYCEQGYGDWIQFVRYAGCLGNAKVVLHCPPALIKLFEPLPAISTEEPPPLADFHCSVMSLPYLLKHGPTTAEAMAGPLPQEGAATG